METKKILGIIFSIIFIGAFAFVLSWAIINFNKVKQGMSGTELFTQEDLNNAYEDGYNTALKDKEEYEVLINSYRDTITTLNDQISQLNGQITILNNNIRDQKTQISKLEQDKVTLQENITTLQGTIANNNETISNNNTTITNLQNQITELTKSEEDKTLEIKTLNNQIESLRTLNQQLQTSNESNLNTIKILNNQIVSLNEQVVELTKQVQGNSGVVNSLNVKISQLEKSIEYYEDYIKQLETGEQVVATFEFDGSVISVQILSKGGKASIIDPVSTEYIIFNYWTVDGQKVNLNEYTLTQNTKFIANVTYKYDVKFMVDSEQYKETQIVEKEHFANLPDNPSKAEYEFDGWTINGVDVVDVSSYKITGNTVFIAKFTQLFDVTFMYENETKSTQKVRSGECAQNVEVENTTYKVFNGWKLNGVIVDVTKQQIVGSVTFIADITYKFDVKFMVDGSLHDSQIVAEHGKITPPETPTKPKYVFTGWSVDGETIVDLDSYDVTEAVTFTALFKLDKLEVKFMSNGRVVDTQAVDKNSYASTPSFTSDTFKGWSIDGESIIDVESYQITEDTTFIAVHGTYELLKEEMTYASGSQGTSKIEVSVQGLKVGDRFKISITNFVIKDGRVFAGGSPNYWEGYIYVGSGGNCPGNDAWANNDGYSSGGWMNELTLNSAEPYTMTLGYVSYGDYNEITITLKCEQDGILTIEWADEAQFYINDIWFYYVYVLR